ncbi:MAG TPA: hypothetical protein PLA50_12320, partial [Bacteroidia bacterium]|nr:hypothetical protein [Bacteroidia bacterium]
MPPSFSSPAIGAFAAAFLLTAPPPFVFAEDPADDLRSRLRIAHRELESLRSSLHEALVELAARDERIEALEATLNGAGETSAPLVAKAEKKADTEARPAPPTEPAPKPEPEIGDSRFEVIYAEHSAVSYEGREAALAWLSRQIERDPAFTVRIVGTANDSRYPDANQDIAGNRAKFLADYLAMHGIPRTAIVSL